VEFLRSAASPADLPRDGLLEIPIVGRSNVGKSSLINALAGQRVARTSAAPGKTRLANIYRVAQGSGRPSRRGAGTGGADAFYLVDLPGYGYARGRGAAREFAALVEGYFGWVGQARLSRPIAGVVLALDGRHPGLPQDLEALDWLLARGLPLVQVATKIDRLSRREREQHLWQFSNSSGPVLAVSARTGEGMDALWKAIVKLTTPAL
jgi:GTP-binding protein